MVDREIKILVGEIVYCNQPCEENGSTNFSKTVEKNLPECHHPNCPIPLRKRKNGIKLKKEPLLGPICANQVGLAEIVKISNMTKEEQEALFEKPEGFTPEDL